MAEGGQLGCSHEFQGGTLGAGPIGAGVYIKVPGVVCIASAWRAITADIKFIELSGCMSLIVVHARGGPYPAGSPGLMIPRRALCGRGMAITAMRRVGGP